MTRQDWEAIASALCILAMTVLAVVIVDGWWLR